ncbi:MAG: hypothetical protein WC679_01710 [Bacteroidales bacterium]|jgi:hypothetical protein
MLYYVEYLTSTLVEASDIEEAYSTARKHFHEAQEQLDENDVVLYQTKLIENEKDFKKYGSDWDLNCIPFGGHNTIGDILHLVQ